MTATEAVLVIFLGWFFASLLKGIISKDRIIDGADNGGMPSSHSATAVGLTALFYLQDGASPLFFLALYLSIVIGTDAVRVRKTLEIQTRRLNELLEERGEEPTEVISGHTTQEVWAGALLGILVALGVFYAPTDQLF